MAWWDDSLFAVLGAGAGWVGNTVKFASERKQKEAELDQKDAELAQKNRELTQTAERDADVRRRAQEDRDLELIDKARELLKSSDEDDKIAGRSYLMGLIRVQEERTALVDEILNQFSQKEFGAPVAQIRAAGTRQEEYVVIVGDSVALTDDVVAELTTGEDGGTSGTEAAGEGRGHDDEANQGHQGDP